MKPALESLLIFHRYTSISIPETLYYRQATMCTDLELSDGYSAATLDLLDDREDLLEERV